MKKLAILILALLFVGIEANAQVVAGAGYIYSSEKTSGYDSSLPYHGFFLGASYNIHLVAGLGVAPGLYASFLRHKETAAAGGVRLGYNVNGYIREFALNLPVNLNYAIDLGRERSIFAYAGPVFQLGLTNTTTVNGSATIAGVNFSDGQKIDNYAQGYANRFNIYLGGGLGVQIGDILVHVGYDRSMLDIDTDKQTVTARNQLKIGFALAF